MKKNIFLLSFLIIALFFSCKNTESNSTDMTEFNNFYKKFHRDSVFQKAHIRFPLPGFPSFADSMVIVRNDFYWQEKDWLIQEEVDFESGDFKQELQVLGDNVILERVFLQEGVFIERRFYKSDGEWALIYYSDLNFGGVPE